MAKAKKLSQKEQKKLNNNNNNKPVNPQNSVSFLLGNRAHDKYGNPVWM